jgi:hypothetical protein
VIAVVGNRCRESAQRPVSGHAVARVDPAVGVHLHRQTRVAIRLPRSREALRVAPGRCNDGRRRRQRLLIFAGEIVGHIETQGVGVVRIVRRFHGARERYRDCPVPPIGPVATYS